MSEEIKNLNENANVYLVGYYCPFYWVDSEYKDKVNEVFLMLNESVRDVSELMGVYYVDISDVSEERNMFDKHQIYLNQDGQKYVFNIIKDTYFQ